MSAVRWRDIGLVFIGGMLGTLARFGVTTIVPTWGAVPVATFFVNVVGAFALGCLVEALVHGGDDVGARRGVRLFVGTGVLGGFTTYSALAVDTDGLLLTAPPALGVLYAGATVLVGAAASLAGIAVGAAAFRRRRS